MVQKFQKISLLLQAALGGIDVQDVSLKQETTMIFGSVVRLVRCMIDVLKHRAFISLYHAVLLYAV